MRQPVAGGGSIDLPAPAAAAAVRVQDWKGVIYKLQPAATQSMKALFAEIGVCSLCPRT